LTDVAVADELFGEASPVIKQYVDILRTDGVTRGLIGPRETDRLWDRHIYNSVAIAGLIRADAEVVDVGSGAGLPGIPLAVLRLDRMRALVDVYPGVEREDEMVAAFDFCLHGKAGAAPSIDTAMHGLVDDAHVDHLHPDAGIAFATAVGFFVSFVIENA